MFNHTCSFVRYLDSLKINLELLYIHTVSQTTVNFMVNGVCKFKCSAWCSQLIMFND